MLNLSGLVSRGGGEEASIWRDVAGQDGSMMSLDVLQLLSAACVPRLQQIDGHYRLLQDVTLLINVWCV